jgi:glycosyltransferase involved in cell wall biosynthesis
MKTISLCMIVKDEAHVIKRCLTSVKPLIDYVLIVDTGSTDGTPDVIKEWLEQNNISGEVLIEPWKNFAHNRSFALSELRKREFIDYSLMLDADEILIFEDEFDVMSFKTEMTHDIYDVKTDFGGFTYYRHSITSNKKICRYEGVVHEFLVIENEESRGIANGFFNRPIQDSARNKSGNKFLKDIELLKEALSGEVSDWLRSRYTFYLAQSYRDSGNKEESLKYYLERSEMGFWNEEVYMSLYNAGNIMNELGYPQAEVFQTWWKSAEKANHRIEALYQIVKNCRISGLNTQGWIIGKHALSVPIPQNSLFVETWIWNYGILDEFAVCSYWAGDYLGSKMACEKLLEEGKIPAHYYERVTTNLNFAKSKL